MIRQASAADIPALTKLEQAAFGDSDAFCWLIFEQFAGLENVWLEDNGQGPISMALTVPVTLSGVHGVYLYALTTAQAYRSTGRMTAMLQHLKEVGQSMGWAFLCLIPANGALAEYYAARGFEQAFFRYAYRTDIPRNILATAEFDDITVSLLPQLRRRFCHLPVPELKQSSLAAVMTDFFTSGGSTVRTADAYGLYHIKNGVLCFDELFAADDRAAMELLQACREKTRCERAVLFSDRDLAGRFGRGERIPTGMLCRLGQQTVLSGEGYMCPMMDD